MSDAESRGKFRLTAARLVEELATFIHDMASHVTDWIPLLTRLAQELLEQPAQLERRALAAVGHDRRCDVARAIDLPVANRRASRPDTNRSWG
jgi:hypothetical protein